MPALFSLNFRNQNKSKQEKDENFTKETKMERMEIMESDFHNNPENIKLVIQNDQVNVSKPDISTQVKEPKKECVLFQSDTLCEYQKQNLEAVDPLNSKWHGEFDKKGKISCIGSHGNIRVLAGDTLTLRLYNGIIQGENFVVTLEDFFGDRKVVPPKNTDSLGNFYWDLEMTEPGSIQISISITTCFQKSREEINQLNDELVSNIIIVEPKLYINKSFIPSSGICMQTILSQCLGNIQNWKRRLEITSKLNYNMVHFTPLQIFGQSGSCYSLANQNEISSLFFNNKFDQGHQDQKQNLSEKEVNFGDVETNSEASKAYTPEEKYNILKQVIGELETDYGILSACDIVLNHTADNSPWLREHPESGYNLDNSPHLTAAVELDQKLQEFSKNIYHGKYANSYGIDRNITSIQHVDLIISALKAEVIIPFNIKEFFTLNIHEIIQNSKIEESSQFGLDSKQQRDYDDIIEKINANDTFENKLYNLSLCFSCSSRSKRISIPSYILKKMGLLNIHEQVLEKVQIRLFEFTEQISNNICNSVRGLVIWERLECSKGPIGLNHWESLTPRYFTPIEDHSGNTHYLANNGWVMGWNAKEDFAAPGSFVYLKRDLIVWSDCVKLKYGKCESDCPFLWNWMSDYCRSVANIFHAIRLDNCHSTPLHVAKHMLRVCRKTRPNIWVYAELFTGDYQVDLEFERTLGLNALIREAMRAETPGSLGNYVSNYSTAPIGGLSTVPSMFQTVNSENLDKENQEVLISLPILQGAKPLKRFPCPAIFFDCTHDNETPCEIRTPIDTLPTAALVASTNCALGSTRGFDEIVPHNISVVSERRLYQNYIINVYGDGNTCLKPEDSVDLSLKSRSNSFGPFQKLSSNYLAELSTINWNLGEIKNNNSNISTEITVEWRHPANTVEIRGDWDDWKEGIQLEKHPNGNFITKLFIRFGMKPEQANIQEQEIKSQNSNKIIYPISHRLQYEYKYIVDGNWMHDPNLPYTSDNKGNTNNIITLLKRQRSIAMVSKWKHGDQLPGIMSARKILNKLHQQMALFGFNESHVYYLTQDILMVQRYNPKIQENIYFITHSSFTQNKIDQLPETIVLDGCIKDTVFAGSLFVPNYTSVYKNDTNRIHGLDSELHKYKKLEEISSYSYDPVKNITILNFNRFPPGSLVILHTIRHKGFSVTQNALLEFYRNTQQSLPKVLNNCFESDNCHPSDAINYILFSCNNEELDRSCGSRGVYNVPNLGDFTYSGIYSCIHALDSARKMDDNGISHPFVLHLKQGPWYIDYTIQRLKEYKGTGFNGHKKSYPNYLEQSNSEDIRPLSELAKWVETQYSLINKVANIPIEYIISYIDIMFSSIYRNILYYILNVEKSKVLLETSSKDISEFLIKLDPLYIHLQLATYQVYSYVPSSPLVWNSKIPSLSAGLPHFSTGFMRSWGRDTFIAFNGILISSKRYLEGKEEILGVARLMRHGLIPNLIDSGNRPRYNARDATWFFLNAALEYCVNVPNGFQILDEDIELRFPINLEQDLSRCKEAFEWLKLRFDYSQSQNRDLTSIRILKLSEVIQYIMAKHVIGISFREENAGIQLDEQMTDLGFNIEINWDPSNGLIFGGNIHNCGTWMDKMGSSLKAKNKGIPSSPRDGADIEIIALLYSCINHIINLQISNKFPHKGVTHPIHGFISYSDWSKLIKTNFERCFYIPSSDNNEYLVDYKIVNRREIYKDTFKSTHGWTDYQLRCNLAVAIGVSKDLFDPQFALKSIQAVEKYLFSPNMLGIKTLDPSDYNYRPNYDNSNDSEDYSVAHGFNYHQGPEWVWPMGYFLIAKFQLLKEKNEKTIGAEKATKLAISETMKHLINHRNYLISDNWGSLPELTNDNGSFCKDSCFAQAWSVGTILYFLTSIINKK
ncbi:Gdb1p glycogen debranching enzyme [Cryptosporidium ubiquitum]|uniref:Gdb1p glycogen debranching enzyme n=1 Tax=Cryptosporidium ubiquitum TaxID=857276 RepID=A0A1J4MG40_9CRYT|nr:Gdb1p glycogen debranching enzyme [Cryptosporidium ubiquitum]OII72983.1 Gdb1p glycogen debranching enzyme [Cryptosporidium ubiquitum]